MTTKSRKRDLRTRVAQSTFEQVRRYAAAHQLTPYAAAERLVLIGLDGDGKANEAQAAITSSLDQLAARMDTLAALTDRALFGAMVAYACIRHATVAGLDTEQRQALEQTIGQAADSAYQRQRAKALGGDHEPA